MRICAVIKYPPIQGGVSAQGYWMARGLARAGHQVHVVTNSLEVEDDYRVVLAEDDAAWLEPAFEQGRVTLHATEPMSPSYTHIPQANPFVSKLAGLATDVVQRYGCELVFSYYLEPYGVAAHLASRWTGVPHVVRNAGSDVGRLMNRPGLGPAYREVFRRAEGICAGSPYPYLGMGAKAEAIYRAPPAHLSREHFNPDIAPLDVDAHIADAAARSPELVPNRRPLDPALPIIGIYGKMGVAKGSFDLLAALSMLRKEGLGFQLVAVARGRQWADYVRAVEESGLADVTYLLPFMPHWKIARFIRACRAVCFLERDFPIAFHAPTVPREVLACGTCLVVSGEIARKQRHFGRMIHGENVVIVDDPKVHGDLAAALRRVLQEPAWASEVGRRGTELVTDAHAADGPVSMYEAIFRDVVARARGEQSTISAEDRGLPRSLRDALRAMLPALFDALGAAADDAVAAYERGRPDGERSLFADARAFCAFVMEHQSGAPDPAIRDAARYCELLLWMGTADPVADATPPFDRPDRAPARRGPEAMEAVRRLAPLRSRWLRIERFGSLPAGYPKGAEPVAAGGALTLVFHKQPNMNGHHFRVNAWTAELLEQCDGSRTVDAIIQAEAARTSRPVPEVSRVVMEALTRFRREGLIVLSEVGSTPREGR